MLDEKRLTHPIAPRSRAVRLALMDGIALHMRKLRQPGVAFRLLSQGISIDIGGVTHLLVPSDGARALDEAIRQLEDWGAIKREGLRQSFLDDEP
jgi:hypothetical protein